jgi:dipeptidase
MHLLRDHGPDTDEDWQPGKGLTGAEVCMHASFGPVRISQTAGSMVSHLSKDGDTHWVTGTAAPCTSVFKPVWLDAGLPDLGPAPTETYDERTLWWQHENLHRELLRDYAIRINVLKPEQETLEAAFLKDHPAADAPLEERQAFTRECFAKVSQMEAEVCQTAAELPEANYRPVLDQLAWRNLDKQAKRL